MKKVIVALLVFYGFSVHSQSTDITNFFKSDLQKAELLYSKAAFKNAIELYERVLEKNPNELKAIIRIAECYTALNDPLNATAWYAKVIESKEPDPRHYYIYAQALSSTGQYKEAEKWYKKYKLTHTSDQRVPSKLSFIEAIDFYRRDTTLYFLENLPINTENSDFGAVPYANGLIFLSSRDEDLFIKYKESEGTGEAAEARLDLYYSAANDTAYATPTKFNPTINTRFHEGPIAFYHREKKVIFTRNNFYHHKKSTSKDGQIKLKLFITSQKEDKSWSETMESFTYNNDEYSVAHPSLSQDDQVLYFSSDMPGGFGGSDLYYCVRQGDNWSQPVNLGAVINTAGEEMFPFIAYDSNLYFASDGHGGFGGLDIYRSYQQNGTFTIVENLGYPLNTPADDFAFVLDQGGRGGYLSSNRPGGYGGDDIYRFHRRYLSVAGQVIESGTGAEVDLVDIAVLDSGTMGTTYLKADQKGAFHMDLPLDTRFSISVKREGYSPYGYTSFSSAGGRFETDTVLIEMWKHRLFAEGRVFSNETHELLTDVKISLINHTSSDTLTATTGADGEYWFVLKSDQHYTISAELEDHLQASFNLNTAGMIEDTLKNDFVLEEKYLNKDVVFFDFNAHDLNPQAIAKLDYMAGVMKKYKHTFIVISAHADAQGSFAYNKNLSDHRAKSVVSYLKTKGINPDRISWYGFGEELLINKCSDGVECLDEDHSLNRRAELKIEEERPKSTRKTVN